FSHAGRSRRALSLVRSHALRLVARGAGENAHADVWDRRASAALGFAALQYLGKYLAAAGPPRSVWQAAAGRVEQRLRLGRAFLAAPRSRVAARECFRG